MKIQIACCLFSVALLSACSSTSQTTADNQTLEQKLSAKYATADTKVAEPAPPAEGPDDVPAEAPANVDHNPALMPSPELRADAAAGL